MPGSVKVKIIAARNLPIMDRSTFLTDAFVEVRIGNEFFKTDVVKRSLNPQWNSEWIIFELDDQQLQEEVLQIRVFDHDTYSAHDSIGRVYIDLNALLVKKNNRCLSGWLSIYDTMHGIRGEINVAVKVDLFSDVSKFRQSSVGVKFFYSSCIPVGFNVITLFGFVEELVMMEDPEHQWREKLRTSRASNETRQRVFSKLSGELQRKMGVKVLEMGGNSVIGYQLHFDLEGETGVVIRGIGTVAELYNIKADSSSSPTSPIILDVNSCNIFESKSSSSYKETDEVMPNKSMVPSIPPIISKKLFDLGIFPFLTISLAPPNFIKNFGSVVSVKSVKLIEKNQTGDERECRDAWWLELRTEIASHMRIMNCNAVLGYSENCIIDEDVCVLIGYGTAVILDTKYDENPGTITETLMGNNIVLAPEGLSFFSGLKSNTKDSKFRSHHPPNLNIDIARKFSGKMGKTAQNKLGCQLCHLPEGIEGCTFTNVVTMCRICNLVPVPEVIFSTSEIPEILDFCGKPALIQARVCRYKKENKGELCAKEINDILPFLEYEMHYKLVQNLSMKGLNAIFGLTVRLCIGENLIVAIGTGTGVFLPPLPLPMIPKSNHHIAEEDNLILKMREFRSLSRIFLNIPPNKTNIEVLCKTEKSIKAETPSNEYSQTNVSSQCRVSNKIFNRSVSESSKRTSLTDNIFIDTSELNHDYINSVIKEGFSPSAITMETINSVRCKFFKNYPQMIFRFVRSIPLANIEGSSNIGSLTSEKLDLFMHEFHTTLWLKLRQLMPCVVAGIDYTFNVTEDEGFEAMLTGFVSSTNVYYNENVECGKYQRINEESGLLTYNSDNAENIMSNESLTNVNETPPPPFLISPLSSISGYNIEVYLGSLNFFFVRETTSIREFGGVSGFIQALIGEVQTVVASQTMAIGGSGLLSCHITEMILNYPTNGRQMNSAQCLINICGDMVQGHF